MRLQSIHRSPIFFPYQHCLRWKLLLSPNHSFVCWTPWLENDNKEMRLRGPQTRTLPVCNYISRVRPLQMPYLEFQSALCTICPFWSCLFTQWEIEIWGCQDGLMDDWRPRVSCSGRLIDAVVTQDNTYRIGCFVTVKRFLHGSCASFMKMPCRAFLDQM